MKNIKYIIIISFVTFMLACTNEDFESINTNIDELSSENVNTLDLVNNGFFAFNSFQDSGLRIFMDWAHQNSFLNGPEGAYDNFNDEGIWTTVYSSNKNLLDALNRTTEATGNTEKGARAMALILRSYSFLRLTDSFGDVPYSEAGFEDETGIIENPVYDSQESIYKDIFTKLGEAINLIGTIDFVNLGPADRIYNGDLQKWKLFANSLRYRMALRVQNVDASLSNSWFAEVDNSPLIDSNANEASYVNFDQTNYQNPFFNQLSSGTRTHVSNILVDQLRDTNDPRLSLYAMPTNNDPTAFVGLENGQTGAGITFDDFSFIGSSIFQIDQATPVLLYSEICFIRAERFLLGLGAATQDLVMADSWYKAGIRSSMEFWGVIEADILTFLTTPEASLTGDEENMKRLIATQKWLSFFSNGGEAHAEIKRTGYPIIPVRDGINSLISLGETNGEMPRRIKYVDNELLLNEANYQQAVSATNDNSLLYRMWWDVN